MEKLGQLEHIYLLCSNVLRNVSVSQLDEFRLSSPIPPTRRFIVLKREYSSYKNAASRLINSQIRSLVY